MSESHGEVGKEGWREGERTDLSDDHMPEEVVQLHARNESKRTCISPGGACTSNRGERVTEGGRDEPHRRS